MMPPTDPRFGRLPTRPSGHLPGGLRGRHRHRCRVYCFRDCKGNLWAASARLGGMLQIDPRGIILGFVPIPNSDLATTNFAFGGPDNQYIYFEGAISGTFWKFKAPYPGLIGPGGVRLPAQ